jgi:hypothetical protein
MSTVAVSDGSPEDPIRVPMRLNLFLAPILTLKTLVVWIRLSYCRKNCNSCLVSSRIEDLTQNLKRVRST